jgi:hypothetical protein
VKGLAALVACVASATSAFAQEERPAPPVAALVSANAALDVVLNKVCLPAILEVRSIEELARANYMLPVDAEHIGANAGANDRAWRLGSMADASVVAWADGSCMAGVEDGSPDELRDAALAALAALGFAPGRSEIVDRGRSARVTYCTQGSPPVVAAITTAVRRGRRAAFVATVFRARAAAPSFCAAEVSQ